MQKAILVGVNLNENLDFDHSMEELKTLRRRVRSKQRRRLCRIFRWSIMPFISGQERWKRSKIWFPCWMQTA